MLRNKHFFGDDDDARTIDLKGIRKQFRNNIFGGETLLDVARHHPWARF